MTTVPLETAEIVAEIEHLLDSLRSVSIPLAVADLSVALMIAKAARMGSVENVYANLKSVRDGRWAELLQQKLKPFESA